VVFLYQQLFHANFLEVSPDRPSVLAPTLPAGLDSHAAASIRIIEVYQKQRKAYFMGFSRTTDYVGDIRTRILEELKKWLLTLAGDSLLDVEAISARLEYCRQLLLRPAVFEGSNENSFMKTLAQVCKQLEALLQQAASGQRSAERKLARLMNLGRDLCEATLPVLIYSVSAMAPAETPQGLALLRSAERYPTPSSSSTAPATQDIDWNSDVGSVLRSLLTTPSVRTALNSDVSDEATEFASRTSSFGANLGEVRKRWQDAAEGQRPLGSGSGLFAAFCAADQGSVRMFYLDLAEHVERLAFFLRVLRPYHLLAGSAGDLGLCRLHRSLRHLLQELDGALLQHRQARLDLMRIVKSHLRRVAETPRLSRSEERWLSSLRNMDERRLDELHKQIARESAEVVSAASAANAAQLQVAARQGLADIATAFNSAEFQARSRMALPEGLLGELRQALPSPESPLPALELPVVQ